MTKKQIRIGTMVYEAVLREQGILNIDNEPVKYELDAIRPDTYLLRMGTRSYEVFVPPDSVSSETVGENSIYIDGERIGYVLEDEKRRLAGRFISVTSTTSTQQQVRAPMPGLVTKILVREGEQVEQGDGVIVLEAMKMENELKAPVTGTIKSISVKEHESVEKNVVLIEFS